jgi:cytochrome P450
MLLRDGAVHTHLRRIVGRAFHPAAITSMRTHIQRIVDRLLDQVVARGAMEVMGELALPYS